MGFPRELMNSMEPQDYLNLIVNIWEKVKRVFEPIDVFMVPRNPIDRTRLLMLLLVQPRSTHRLIQRCGARPAPADAATCATMIQATIDSKVMRSLLFPYVCLDVSTS